MTTLQSRFDWEDPALLRRLVLLLAILLVAEILPAADEPVKIEGRPVRVSTQGDLPKFWEAGEAGFREDSTGTVGYLNIKNISSDSLVDAVFYGEYFDARGRLCFSLVFSVSRGPSGNDSVGPSESRLLDSVGLGLFPSLEPDEVRLYLVQVGIAGRPNSLQKWDVNIRAPVTVKTGGSSGVEIKPLANLPGRGLSDLVLARVTVSGAGLVIDVDVLRACAPEMGSWFRDFIEHQATFYPRTDRGVPQQSDALLLVRVNFDEEKQPLFSPPRTSQWVQSFVGILKESDVPPVTTLVFARPPTKVKPLGSNDFYNRPTAVADQFDLILGDSYWSEPAVHWIADPEMPHHLRREIGLSKHQ